MLPPNRSNIYVLESIDISPSSNHTPSLRQSTSRIEFGIIPEHESNSPYLMTEDILAARARKSKYGNQWRQLFACFTVTLGSISAGYVIGSVAPKIRFHYNITGSSNNEFACQVAFGFAMGSVFTTILSTNHGPRKMMIIAAPFNFLAWLMIPIMNQDSYQSAMMFFCAFLSFSYLTNGALLLLDVIHEAYFYVFFVVFNSGHGLGIMLAFIFGFSPDLEYYVEGLAALILSAYFICLFYCPESPVFLFKKNILQAQQSILFYRGSEDLQIIMRNIHKDLQARVLSVSTKYLFLSPAVYKASLIILGIAVMDVLSGYNLFLMFNLPLYMNIDAAKGKVDVFGQYEDGIIFGCSYFILQLISIAINLRLAIGIRKPVITSAICMPIVLFMHGLHYYLSNYSFYVETFKFLRFVIQILHIFCYNFGYANLLDTMISDYLPEQVQFWVTIGVMFSKYISLAIMLWITYMFVSLLDVTYIILIHGVLSIIGIPFAYYFIVESKGKTLQQIQMDIGGNPIGTRPSFRSRYKKYLNDIWLENQEKKRAAFITSHELRT